MEAQNRYRCRLCLEFINGCDETLLNNSHHLVESIFLITGLQVASDTGQCEFLCSQCQSLLEQCVEFRKTCIDNDDLYRKIMVSGSNLAEEFESEPQELDIVLIKSEPVDLGVDEEVNEVVLEPCALPQENSRSPSAKETPRKKTYKKVECPQCGLVVYNLKTHKETHELNRTKLCCPHCPKAYMKSHQLRQHFKAVHTNELQYRCDKCGKSFANNDSRNEHISAVHLGEKRFACQFCGERFSRASRRSYHLHKVHSMAKPFACDYCDKTFMLRLNLSNHLSTHTSDK